MNGDLIIYRRQERIRHSREVSLMELVIFLLAEDTSRRSVYYQEQISLAPPN